MNLTRNLCNLVSNRIYENGQTWARVEDQLNALPWGGY